MSILRTEQIHSGYGKVEILHDVSIKLKKGEIVSIIGPNGSGKSTLMKTIFGLLKPTKGNVVLGNNHITSMKPNDIVRKGMCYVPQHYNIFPSLTVVENLDMGAFIREDDYGGRLKEILEIFPSLKNYQNQTAGKLSGGEQQMVAMGSALMLDPKVLLLDEPSAGLAPKLANMILQKVSEINESGVAVLMVEQNAREALQLSNRGYVLAMGEKKYEDTGEALLNNEEVGKLYLGG